MTADVVTVSGDLYNMSSQEDSSNERLLLKTEIGCFIIADENVSICSRSMELDFSQDDYEKIGTKSIDLIQINNQLYVENELFQDLTYMRSPSVMKIETEAFSQYTDIVENEDDFIVIRVIDKFNVHSQGFKESVSEMLNSKNTSENEGKEQKSIYQVKRIDSEERVVGLLPLGVLQEANQDGMVTQLTPL